MNKVVQASLTLAAAVLLTVTPAQATTSLTMDGLWWQSLSSNEKIVAIQAMMEGISEGFVLGHLAGRNDSYAMFKVPNQAVLSTIEAGKMPPDSQGTPEFSKTFGIYVDQISLFYKIHPQSTLHPNGLLGMCLSDKPHFTMDICEKIGEPTK